METQSKTCKRSPCRFIIALLTLFPALAFCGLQLFATPDLETWLAAEFHGIARPDAFEGVADIAPLFAVLFGVISLLAAGLVVSRKASCLLMLAAGPLLAGLVYLVMHGVTDPAWFTLLALLVIGMLVGSPVTAVYVAVRAKRHQANATN